MSIKVKCIDSYILSLYTHWIRSAPYTHEIDTTLCLNAEYDTNGNGKTSFKGKSIGIDEKGREIYQGIKGGVYYFTPSGKRVYKKKKWRRYL